MRGPLETPARVVVGKATDGLVHVQELLAAPCAVRRRVGRCCAVERIRRRRRQLGSSGHDAVALPCCAFRGVRLSLRRTAACSRQLRIHMNGAGASGYRSGGSFLSNETDESLEDQGLNPAIESGEGFYAKQTLDALDWPLLLTHLVGECPLLPPT